MSPPTEQLIRDYLNRLSVAARGTLAPEDRKALIERTHDLIDRKAKSTDAVTSMEVAALLSRLGDPAVIVSREAARLATSPGDPVEMRQERQPRRPGLLRRRAGQETWHRPRSSGGSDGQTRVLNADPETASKPATRTPVSFRAPPAGGSAGSGSTTSGGPAAEGQSDEREPPIWVPRQAASPETVPAESPAAEPVPVEPVPVEPVPAEPVPAETVSAETVSAETGHDEPEADEPEPEPEAESEPEAASDAGAKSAEPGSSPERPRWPSVVAMTSGGGAATAASADEPDKVALWVTQEQPVSDSWEQPADDLFINQPRLIRAGRLLSRAAVRNSREHPLEAAAVVLLGLGGAAYPPVWLLGAAVAAASRAWDYRDKWIGLAGPVVLLVVGTVAGVALGSQRSTFSSYWHEGWLYADVLSRVGALLGAVYLAWRIGRGRREPPVPPWNRPHRVG